MQTSGGNAILLGLKGNVKTMDYINLQTTETWLLNSPVIAFSDLVSYYWYYIQEVYRYIDI